MIIKPQVGPQESILSCDADIAIFGGAAGGGKSWALMLDALRYAATVPGFSAVLFRETFPDLKKAGGLWEKSQELYLPAGGTPRENDLYWRWENGGRVDLSHFQHPKYMSNWQGSEICMIGWDELTHFSEQVFFYMLSRNRSTCGVRPYIRATCNPDPDSWVREFISWWINDETGLPIPQRAGVVRYFVRLGGEITWYGSRDEIPEVNRAHAKSMTFIPSRLEDNPALMKADPQYLSNLLALPHHEKERLLGGNWNIRVAAGDYFKRGWFEVVDAAPRGGRTVRYWDRAATEPSENNPDPDWTVGLKMTLDGEGICYVTDIVRFRGRPDKVRKTIRNTASLDGKDVEVWLEEDPGQAGKTDIDILTRYLMGYVVRSRRADKAKEVRAQAVSAHSEAGNVKLVRGPWLGRFFSEIESFPDPNLHDDQVDALSGAYNTLSEAVQGAAVRFL